MHDAKASRSMLMVLRSLGWPLLYGMAAYSALFVLIRKEVITNALLVRYLESHPVSYVATAMFCVGIAALVMMAIEVVRQSGKLNRVTLGDTGDGPQPVEECDRHIDHLESLPVSLHSTALWRRLYDALTLVKRKDTAEGLDEELKYLADQDAIQQQQNHSLVRILIWATPMLGFLGTVIGISEALGGLKVSDGDFESMMQGLQSSLYIAFDTTALALTLSIILMFVQFLVDRFESQLLGHVEQLAAKELVGRFEEVGGGNDPVVKSMERLAKAMMSVSGQLVERQAELWRDSMDEAQKGWQQTSSSASKQIRDDLGGALDSSLSTFAEKLEQAQKSAEQAATRRWEQLQVVISDNARQLANHQSEMTRQSEILKQAVDATGEVVRLESALNQNLDALSNAGQFEETVTSLAATIHLLNSRLKEVPSKSAIELSKKDSTERAA